MAGDLIAEMERCRPWIEAALKSGGDTHDFEDIVQAVQSGFMQFWPAPDACAVTEMLVYPKKKVLHVFLAGGNMETIIAMNESAEQFAKFNGCSEMSIAGRKGWIPMLKSKGYAPTFFGLSKEFSDG